MIESAYVQNCWLKRTSCLQWDRGKDSLKFTTRQVEGLQPGTMSAVKRTWVRLFRSAAKLYESNVTLCYDVDKEECFEKSCFEASGLFHFNTKVPNLKF